MGIKQHRAREFRLSNVDELKQRLIDAWNGLQQNVIDSAVNDWRKQRRIYNIIFRYRIFGTGPTLKKEN